MHAVNGRGFPASEPTRTRPGWGARVRRIGGLVLVLAVLGASATMTGCKHAPPVKPWQRGYLTKRAMTFETGLEGKFKQHVFSAREGAEGGYGHVGGGCGCN
jgi:Domain of unknown function (DUF4266)